MAAYGLIEGALEGMICSNKSDILSRVAGGEINFGKALVAYAGDATKVYQYLLDQVELTFSADFVSLNVATVTVNGVTITSTFVDTHANMLADVVAKLEALAGVTASNPSGRIVRITTAGAVCVVTAAVTLGASQATTTQAASCTASVIGVCPRSNRANGKFIAKDIAPVMREGQLWVMTADAVVANADAYLVKATGVWTDDSSSNISTGFKFRGNTSGAALVELEVIK